MLIKTVNVLCVFATRQLNLLHALALNKHKTQLAQKVDIYVRSCIGPMSGIGMGIGFVLPSVLSIELRFKRFEPPNWPLMDELHPMVFLVL